ncbi:hypothetical protein [Azospirillum rugosum]|uniref:hypothetical protein n=1 Tax=Azospirillum rugosum TaxID=416170 RepID=UPI0027804282|nr:hypothetical protein [Azospirillum rugosum]MDQ0525329.1 hypothetical protein [Azospirillum rugosum]
MKTTSFLPSFCVGSSARTSTGAAVGVVGAGAGAGAEPAAAAAAAVTAASVCAVAASWLSGCAALGSACWSTAGSLAAVATPAASNMKRGSSAMARGALRPLPCTPGCAAVPPTRVPVTKPPLPRVNIDFMAAPVLTRQMA